MSNRVKQQCLYCDIKPALLGQHKCVKCGGDIILHNRLKKERATQASQLRYQHTKQAYNVSRGTYYKRLIKQAEHRETNNIASQIDKIDEYIKTTIVDWLYY